MEVKKNFLMVNQMKGINFLFLYFLDDNPVKCFQKGM